MAHEIGRVRAVMNAVLAIGVIAVAVFGASRVAMRHWQWQKTFLARVEMADIAGLELGGKVRIQGMDAGAIESILPPAKPGQPITLVLRVDDRLRGLVRADATARIGSHGLIGGKVVEIVPGLPDAPPVLDGALLKAEKTVELADLLKDASETLKTMKAVAVAAERGVGEISAIAAEIREGKGTLGKLVRDDDAYRKLMAMSSRGEKVLGDLDENLLAIKQVWPISRYFNGRGFDDRDLALFHPGSERETQTFRGDDLFEPGRAVLTTRGRLQLDGFAAAFARTRRPQSTEIVIAAFTDEASGGEDLAQALTQEQAESVRSYLTKTHGIDSAGWFSSRKVAAVGFGSQTPRTLAKADTPRIAPARRVEIHLFTPQV